MGTRKRFSIEISYPPSRAELGQPETSPVGHPVHGGRGYFICRRRGEGIMVDDRPNSCGPFRDGKCRYQNDMAKLYLIPQVLEPRRLAEYEKMCCSCRDYVSWSADGRRARSAYMDGSPADFFLDGLMLAGSLFPETASF